MSDVVLCVYCRQRPAAVEWRPFCCDRCKWADLGRWLSEDYRVPAAPPDDESEAARAPAEQDDESR
jgi:endogenous inhibitor of DNA gyrase (YacG/DUF329 family)